MLPHAALDIASRIGTKLMTLVGAIRSIIIDDPSDPIPLGHPAIELFFRLSTLVTTLIRLRIGGPRTPAGRKAAAPSAPDPAPRSPPDRTPSTRRRPGWVLELLPDIAPAVAADLAALLADPAFATLIAAAPTLNRKLRPLLRGLGLTPFAAPSPPPDTPPPATMHPDHDPDPAHAPPAHRPNSAALSRRTENHPPGPETPHAQFVPHS